MNRFAIKNGLLQSDLDCAGHNLLNFTGGGGGTSTPAGTYNVKDHGLVGDGVTDDTAALQALINLVGANGQGGTIYFPDAGPYIIGGPLQDPTHRNAQLILPTFTIPGNYVSIIFKGYLKPTFGSSPDAVSHAFLPNGTIIKSTLAAGSGSGPAIINGRGAVGAPFSESDPIWVTFEDLTFVTVANPSYSALNLQYVTYVAMKDVNVVAGNDMGEGFIVQPTTVTSYGIILPDNSRSLGLDLSGEINVIGFYTGFRWGELATAKVVVAQACMVGIEFAFCYHSSMIQRFLNLHNVRGALFSGVHPITILQFDTERQAAGYWNSPVYEIDDGSNQGSGNVTWLTVVAVTGRVSSFNKNGGTGIQTRELGDSTVMIGSKARLTAIAGPPGGTKLQVLNNSGVWEDMDSWTAST